MAANKNIDAYKDRWSSPIGTFTPPKKSVKKSTTKKTTSSSKKRK